MKLAPGNLKWGITAIPLLALSFALAMPARPPAEPTPAPDYSVRHCESYPYTVDCARNQTPGGPIGCFDTLCDAAAAGAYQCKRLQGACEPHP